MKNIIFFIIVAVAFAQDQNTVSEPQAIEQPQTIDQTNEQPQAEDARIATDDNVAEVLPQSVAEPTRVDAEVVADEARIEPQVIDVQAVQEPANAEAEPTVAEEARIDINQLQNAAEGALDQPQAVDEQAVPEQARNEAGQSQVTGEQLQNLDDQPRQAEDQPEAAVGEQARLAEDQQQDLADQPQPIEPNSRTDVGQVQAETNQAKSNPNVVVQSQPAFYAQDPQAVIGQPDLRYRNCPPYLPSWACGIEQRDGELVAPGYIAPEFPAYIQLIPVSPAQEVTARRIRRQVHAKFGAHLGNFGAGVAAGVKIGGGIGLGHPYILYGRRLINN